MHVTARRQRDFRPLSLLALFLAVLMAALPLRADDKKPAAPAQPEPPKIGWQKGPFVAKLGSVAEINVPEGYEFADGDGARKVNELSGNPSNGSELGVMVPLGHADADNWAIFFEFDETGYVKDDEKTSIDAGKLMDSIKKGTEQENEERKKRGWVPFHVLDWQLKPFYDQTTNNLTWSIIGEAENEKHDRTINYNTRILGRRGVMRTDLVLDPSLSATVPAKYNELMKGFHFTAGSRYADFVKGDKVAEYGLTALIAGGATAVALKTGLFAKLLALLAGLWKVIAVGLAALATRIKNIWNAIRGRSGDSDKAPTVEDHQG